MEENIGYESSVFCNHGSERTENHKDIFAESGNDTSQIQSKVNSSAKPIHGHLSENMNFIYNTLPYNINQTDSLNYQKQKISKFDMVKIKITIGKNQEHWFILSRFILSRLLKVIGIRNQDCTKIAFEVKRKLIIQGNLTIKEHIFHETLFQTIKDCNYNDIYKERYLMMNSFYSSRTPLIIIIAGSEGVGKSQIASLLSGKMNISNVLQTKIVEYVTSSMLGVVFERRKVNDEVTEGFLNQCKIIRKGCSLDIQKAFKEGKAVILEGSYILPKLFCAVKEIEVNVDVNDKILSSASTILKSKSKILKTITIVNEDEDLIRNSMNSIIAPFLIINSNQPNPFQTFLLNNNTFEVIDIALFNKKTEQCVDIINNYILDKIQLKN